MFGSSSTSTPSKSDSQNKSPSPDSSSDASGSTPAKGVTDTTSGEKRSGNGSPPGRIDNGGSAAEKKRRSSSGVGGKASNLIASAKNSLNFSQVGSRVASELSSQTPLQKLGKQDPALAVPQGQHNNSAGESVPGPRSTFQVGVWEDRNRKCRRTMEDTHAFLYNFLSTPAVATDTNRKSSEVEEAGVSVQDMVESDNGYFAIFDGHAGTFAADWCGKKLHIILEEMVRKNPNSPIPELLDQTFTAVDNQLEKLPLKNSGCTAAVAVLRWEDRVPRQRSATGSQAIAPAAVAATVKAASKTDENIEKGEQPPRKSSTNSADSAKDIPSDNTTAKLKKSATRQRVLYTANVGDARLVLCRSGKALRLSYDHKGGDENEGKRIANAGGLILNNRVNGVLAVTRALGDTYMKDLVTGHPFTTETVIQPDIDEFIIIACDGLWDVCSDQEAVDLVRDVQDPAAASKQLVDHALSRFSTDNLSCMIVRLDKDALLKTQNEGEVGVDGEVDSSVTRMSEAEKIVAETKQKVADGAVPAVGVSATNNGLGLLIARPEDQDGFVPGAIDGIAEEGPGPEVGGETSEGDLTNNAQSGKATEQRADAKKR